MARTDEVRPRRRALDRLLNRADARRADGSFGGHGDETRGFDTTLRIDANEGHCDSLHYPYAVRMIDWRC